MILVFGGAYQGKLDYAKQNFNIRSVSDCADTAGVSGGEPDFSADAVCGGEAFVRRCSDEGREAADFFRENRDRWEDCVLIITDVSQGIVPMDAGARAFREMNGRLMLYLAGEASRADRVFCGIGMRIK